MDEALGIVNHQKSSDELVRLGCLFSLFVPYELAAWLLGQFSGLQVSASSLWNWVEHRGHVALAELSEQLAQQQAGQCVAPDVLNDTLASLPLLIGADGVMVPMRPHPNTPKGKTVWREVKVGILSRLGTRLTRSGESVSQLLHRRLVAVLGPLEQFIPVLQLEAHRQSMESAPQVIWISDGGEGSGESIGSVLPTVPSLFSISTMPLGISGEPLLPCLTIKPDNSRGSSDGDMLYVMVNTRRYWPCSHPW